MPTLAEGLAEAVDQRRDQLALLEADRQRRQLAERTALAQAHLANLYRLVGAQRVLHSAPPAEIISCGTEDNHDAHEFVSVRDDGVTVAVRLWPPIGTKHEENRAYLIDTCEKCKQPFAAEVAPIETAAGWADAHMTPAHRDVVKCDEPF